MLLEVDASLDRVDRYGRLLRYVKRGGMNVNIALVRIGASAPYFYGGERGKYADRILAEATRARASKRVSGEHAHERRSTRTASTGTATAPAASRSSRARGLG